MKLYYHKTDGGAEYLTDKYIVSPNGEKEGIFEGANYIVRIDGDITKDAELSIKDETALQDKLHRRNLLANNRKKEIEELKLKVKQLTADCYKAEADLAEYKLNR
jgi:hypothetical protein